MTKGELSKVDTLRQTGRTTEQLKRAIAEGVNLYVVPFERTVSYTARLAETLHKFERVTRDQLDDLRIVSVSRLAAHDSLTRSSRIKAMFDHACWINDDIYRVEDRAQRENWEIVS